MTSSIIGNGGDTALFNLHSAKNSTVGDNNGASINPKQNIAIPAAGGFRKMSMSGNTFQLTINISNAENDAAISFKQDGQRFETSPRTFKFHSSATYKCTFKTKPPIEFQSVHLGGSDIKLVGSPGAYTAIWNTTGIDVTKKGARHDILFIISGPDGSLRKTFQTKFYANGDGHADYGHKLDSLIWTCEIDSPSGTINVKDEQGAETVAFSPSSKPTSLSPL